MGESAKSAWQIFQENVRRTRKYLGLTQSEAGERTGMQQNQYSRMEVADFDPRLSALLRVSEALQVPLADLFRDPLQTDSSLIRLAERINDLPAADQEPIIKVIEAYLERYETPTGAHPDYKERLKILESSRRSGASE